MRNHFLLPLDYHPFIVRNQINTYLLNLEYDMLLLIVTWAGDPSELVLQRETKQIVKWGGNILFSCHYQWANRQGNLESYSSNYRTFVEENHHGSWINMIIWCLAYMGVKNGLPTPANRQRLAYPMTRSLSRRFHSTWVIHNTYPRHWMDGCCWLIIPVLLHSEDLTFDPEAICTKPSLFTRVRSTQRPSQLDEYDTVIDRI